jgi:hypothetical protein
MAPGEGEEETPADQILVTEAAAPAIASPELPPASQSEASDWDNWE